MASSLDECGQSRSTASLAAATMAGRRLLHRQWDRSLKAGALAMAAALLSGAPLHRTLAQDVPHASRAIGGAPEAQWLVAAEASVMLPVAGWAEQAFGAGGSLSASGYRALTRWFLLGLRARGGYLSDGAHPGIVGVADPGAGSVFLLGASLRLRAPICDDLSCGPYLEATGGLGITGSDPRPALEVGVGWTFPIGPISLGPTVRYFQLVQPDGAENIFANDDARLLFFGIEGAWDLKPDPPPPPAPVASPPVDRDGDGIVDPDDACPDDPEDFDGFEDADGCPEADNDQDGILDQVDQCPLEPEDADGFMDDDGCPEPDNDGDRVLDQDDRCPDGMEVLNGVDDGDGCPDEGLIQMVDDRIVLDESVLFSTDRWAIQARAFPVLRAIVNLWRQHPDWQRVSIEGHADYRGNAQQNIELSRRRAQSVADILIELGMPQEVIQVVGYGSARPRVMGFGTRAMSRNRRVEFVVLDMPGAGPDGQREPPPPLEEDAP